MYGVVLATLLLPDAAVAADDYAFVSAGSIQVREKATFEVVYVLGSAMARGDYIEIADPNLRGTRWSLWGHDQVQGTSACTARSGSEIGSVGLITATATRGAVTTTRTSNTSDPLTPVSTRVRLRIGSLAAGDEIVVTYGDTSSNANCGHEMPPRALAHVELPVSVSRSAATPLPLAEPPFLTILAESVASNVLVHTPSYVPAGASFPVLVTILDTYGNPVSEDPITATLGAEWGGGSHTFSESDGGAHTFLVTAGPAGTVERVTVTLGALGTATANPSRVYDPASPPEDGFVYWGDLHVHNGNDYVDDGGAFVDENLLYGRDVSGLDVVSESLKAVGTAIDPESIWETLQEGCQTATVDDEFVYLLGTEWIGKLGTGIDDGHHNFYYDTCDAPLVTQWDEVDHPDGVAQFGSGAGPYEWADERAAESIQTVIVPHATLFTGYNWDSESINNEYRRAAEVVSEWGFSLPSTGEEGSVEDGINSGQRMGFIGASDNHDGWFGNPVNRLTSNVDTGLTAFRAEALTRGDVFGALQGRSTYGTSGERIIVEYAAEDDAHVRSGERYVAELPTFRWSASGTTPLTSVTLYAMPIVEGAIPTALATWTPSALDADGEYTWADWDGVEAAVWLVVQEEGVYSDQPYEYAYASPIWLTGDCLGDDTVDPAGRCQSDTGDTGDTPVDTGGDDTGDTSGTDTGVDSDTGSSDDTSDASDPADSTPPWDTADSASPPDTVDSMGDGDTGGTDSGDDTDGDGVPDSCAAFIASAVDDAIAAAEATCDARVAAAECVIDDDGDGVPDDSDVCPSVADPNQSDADSDGVGDACDGDFDTDGDGVLASADSCDSTSSGAVVDTYGCAVADYCPCTGIYATKASYVACVRNAGQALSILGLLSTGEVNALVSAAQQSSCGTTR